MSESSNPMMPRAVESAVTPHSRGFTLIELLVVIGIIGLLVGVFAPQIFGGRQSADIAATKARIAELVTMVDGYKLVWGDVPPDDYSTLGGVEGAQGAWQFGTDNGKNLGIESLVMHLSMQSKGGGRLDERDEWLANTDGDKAPKTIELLGTKDRKEVVDAWGTPLAYFTARVGSGYGSKQKIVGETSDGMTRDEVDAAPWKTTDGGFVHPRGFQLFSAGPDLLFNTPDDVANFELPGS
jgi:prepilin-type N-terminal cleavage/methylation domain-containing protein